MTRDRFLDARRRAIDRRLETALDAATGTYLAPARAAVLDRDDRWHGRFAARSYAAVAETPDDEHALRAATSTELFRGYYRLRGRLLARLDGTTAESNAWDANANAALLASDYLYTVAYSRLGSLDGAATAAAVETLADASETILETFANTAFRSSPSPTEYASFVEGTTGAIGAGAARIGATLAGADDSRARQFETLGRAFSTGRRIHRVLDDDGDALVAPPIADDRRLRRCARRRFSDGQRALLSLSSAVDVDPLTTFLEDWYPADEDHPDTVAD